MLSLMHVQVEESGEQSWPFPQVVGLLSTNMGHECNQTMGLQLCQGFPAVYPDTHSQELPFLAIQSAALSPSHTSIWSSRYLESGFNWHRRAEDSSLLVHGQHVSVC